MKKGSLRAYALHRAELGLDGQSLTAVQKAIASNRITREPDGTIDFDKADAEWAQNTNPRGSNTRPAAHHKSTPPPRPPDRAPYQQPGAQQQSDAKGFAHARTLKETYMAGLAKLTYEERMGKLVNADEVRAAVSQMITSCRERLISVGGEIRDKLAHTKSPVECQRIVDERIAKALNDLATFRMSEES